MSDLPTGYRWATAAETEAHGITPNPEMLVVPRTTDAEGKPYTSGEADLALPLKPLPRDEFGFVNCSAEFGEMFAVRVTYNTDPDGNWVADDDYSNYTLHGEFDSADLAAQWVEAYPDGDKDLKDIDVVTLNRVRPVAAASSSSTDAEDAIEALVTAIDGIVDRWENGNLAEAVGYANAVANEYREVEPEPEPEPEPNFPQSEEEARECIHGNQVWFGNECGICDGEGYYVWKDQA
jgi:hypothetical protein